MRATRPLAAALAELLDTISASVDAASKINGQQQMMSVFDGTYVMRQTLLSHDIAEGIRWIRNRRVPRMTNYR